MAKQVRAGGAYIELGIRERLDRGLAAAEKKLLAFGKGAIVAGGAMAGAAAGFLGPLLMAASDAQETAGKFDTVFAGQSDSVRQWGNDFADTIGRSRGQVETFMADAQSLFVPIGFDRGSAAELSKTITGLAIDMASFSNKTDEEAFADLQSALMGSGEVMQKYGVALKETDVQQELLNQGLDPEKATEAQRVQARLNIILRGTADAQGDATRTGGSFANQMKRLWGMASNLAIEIGNHLLPPATFLIGLFNDAAKAAFDFAQEHKELIANIVYGVAAFGAAGAALVALGASAIAVPFIFGLMSTGFTMVTSAIGFLMGPGLLIAGVITAIGVAAYRNREFLSIWGQEFLHQIAPVREAMGAIWNVVSITFKGIKDALSAGEFRAAADILWLGVQTAFFTGAEHAAKAFEWLFGAATGWLKGIGDAVLAGNFALAFDIVWAQIQTTFAEGSTAVSKTWSLFVFGLGDTFGEAASHITTAFYGVLESVTAVITSAIDKVREFFLWLDRIDRAAKENGGIGARLILPEGISESILSTLGQASTAYSMFGDEFARRQEKEEQERNARRESSYEALNDSFAESDAALAAKRAERDKLLAEATAGAAGISLGSLAADRLAKLKQQVAAFADEGAVSPAQQSGAQDQQDDGLKLGSSVKDNAGTFSAVGATLLGLGGSGNATETIARNTDQMIQLLRRMPDKQSMREFAQTFGGPGATFE